MNPVENKIEWNKFLERIQRMNEIMQLDCNHKPTHLGAPRVKQLSDILQDELAEIYDVLMTMENDEEQGMVALADLLGDLIVYCVSEAKRWGIPIGLVLGAIMDSQDSKLVDGKPVPGDRPGKFGKGPDYKPPEGAIAKILKEYDPDHFPDLYAKMAMDGEEMMDTKPAADDGVNYEEE